MLIYEKKVDDVRHIYGTDGNVPTEDDIQLTYKDSDGDVIIPEETDTYLDASKDGIQNIIRVSDGKEVNVFLGEECIIGDVSAPEVLSIAVKTAPSTTEYLVGDTLDLTGLIIIAEMADGDTKELTSGFTTSPEAGASLTTSDTSVSVTYGGKTASFNISVAAMSVDKDDIEITLGASDTVTVSNYKTSISAIATSEKAVVTVEGATVQISAADGTEAEDTDTITITDANNQTCSVSVKFIAAEEQNPVEEPVE